MISQELFPLSWEKGPILCSSLKKKNDRRKPSLLCKFKGLVHLTYTKKLFIHTEDVVMTDMTSQVNRPSLVIEIEKYSLLKCQKF